jgi:hypothetical protein
MKRRSFLKRCAGVAAGTALAEGWHARAEAQAAAGEQRSGAIVLEPKPLFDISPLLYMQFMEPLGVTDSSVEAAWDYERDDWRVDFVETTKDLAPGALRFGGLFSRYYKWREGIGPPEKRPWMRNYVWGGKETNRVGTSEFVDLCRRVGAEPLYCVNFLSDGDKRYAATREGNRTGDAREAADWVSYANDPNNAERNANGLSAPLGVKLWQLGNETSYGGKATFSKEQAIRATIDFARAMRERDPSLRLIGWGDSGWAEDLVKQAGEHLEFVAMHMMGQRPVKQDTVLRGLKYQSAPGWKRTFWASKRRWTIANPNWGLPLPKGTSVWHRIMPTRFSPNGSPASITRACGICTSDMARASKSPPRPTSTARAGRRMP